MAYLCSACTLDQDCQMEENKTKLLVRLEFQINNNIGVSTSISVAYIVFESTFILYFLSFFSSNSTQRNATLRFPQTCSCNTAYEPVISVPVWACYHALVELRCCFSVAWSLQISKLVTSLLPTVSQTYLCHGS